MKRNNNKVAHKIPESQTHTLTHTRTYSHTQTEKRMAPIILTADLFFCRAAPFARGARTFRLYLYFIYFLFCSVCLFSSSPLFLRGSFYTVLPAHVHKKLRKHAQQAKA